MLARAAPVIVELPGPPQGKGRPRFSRKTGHAYTPEKTRSYESMLQGAAIDVMDKRAPLEGALKVLVIAHLPIPKSWSKKKKAAALLGALRPTTKPDWENIAKVCDAFNEVVWRDDAQVVEGTITKHYSDRPSLRIEVKEI